MELKDLKDFFGDYIEYRRAKKLERAYIFSQKGEPRYISIGENVCDINPRKRAPSREEIDAMIAIRVYQDNGGVLGGLKSLFSN